MDKQRQRNFLQLVLFPNESGRMGVFLDLLHFQGIFSRRRYFHIQIMGETMKGIKKYLTAGLTFLSYLKLSGSYRFLNLLILNSTAN